MGVSILCSDRYNRSRWSILRREPATDKILLNLLDGFCFADISDRQTLVELPHH